MEPSYWASEHSDALRECFARRLSCQEAATAINRKFNTSYTRSAVIGRARRMGLMGPRLPERSPQAATLHVVPSLSRLGEIRSIQSGTPRFQWPVPAAQRAEMPKLRCVEVEPRHLSLVDLERDDCRYPYGGDEEGEAITFCGHPRRPGSSYCPPHFHLSRGPGTPSERAAHIVLLRAVETERRASPGTRISFPDVIQIPLFPKKECIRHAKSQTQETVQSGEGT
jgi:GcrA cell cycle regulator